MNTRATEENTKKMGWRGNLARTTSKCIYRSECKWVAVVRSLVSGLSTAQLVKKGLAGECEVRDHKLVARGERAQGTEVK